MLKKEKKFVFSRLMKLSSPFGMLIFPFAKCCGLRPPIVGLSKPISSCSPQFSLTRENRACGALSNRRSVNSQISK